MVISILISVQWLELQGRSGGLDAQEAATVLDSSCSPLYRLYAYGYWVLAMGKVNYGNWASNIDIHLQSYLGACFDEKTSIEMRIEVTTSGFMLQGFIL